MSPERPLHIDDKIFRHLSVITTVHRLQLTAAAVAAMMTATSSIDESPASPSMKLTVDEALECNPVGLFQYRLLLLCGFVFMADALEVNLLVFISTCAGVDWNLSDSAKASITGVVFAGILLGSLVWGLVADRIGRKPTFIIVATLISAGGFLSGASPSYGWLLFFRALCGFGIGGMNIPFDLLAEFLPSSHRGRFLVYIEYFWTIGSLLVTGIAWACLSSQGWRFLTYMTAIPVTVTCLCAMYYLPESPRWLLVKGRGEEAERIVRDAAAVNGYSMAAFTLVSDEKVHPMHDASYLDLVRQPQSRAVTLPLWVVWASFGFTYYGLIQFVARVNAGDGDDDGAATCSFDYAAVFVNATAEIVGVAVSAITVDWLGRVSTQKLFYVLAGVSVLLMGVDLPYWPLLIVSMLGRLAIMAASNVTWVITPELYSTDMRTVGHSSAVAWSKLGAFISPYVVVSALSPFALGLVLGVVNIVAALASHALPETTGRFLENFKREVSSEGSAPAKRLFRPSDDHTHNPLYGSFSGLKSPLAPDSQSA